MKKKINIIIIIIIFLTSNVLFSMKEIYKNLLKEFSYRIYPKKTFKKALVANDTKVIKKLVEKEYVDIYEFLKEAIEKGNFEQIKKLFATGYIKDSNHKYITWETRYTPVLKGGFTDQYIESIYTPLFYACKNEKPKLEIIRYLIEKGANPKQKGYKENELGTKYYVTSLILLLHNKKATLEMVQFLTQNKYRPPKEIDIKSIKNIAFRDYIDSLQLLNKPNSSKEKQAKFILTKLDKNKLSDFEKVLFKYVISNVIATILFAELVAKSIDTDIKKSLFYELYQLITNSKKKELYAKKIADILNIDQKLIDFNASFIPFTHDILQSIKPQKLFENAGKAAKKIECFFMKPKEAKKDEMERVEYILQKNNQIQKRNIKLKNKDLEMPRFPFLMPK